MLIKRKKKYLYKIIKKVFVPWVSVKEQRRCGVPVIAR